MAMMFDPNTF